MRTHLLEDGKRLLPLEALLNQDGEFPVRAAVIGFECVALLDARLDVLAEEDLHPEGLVVEADALARARKSKNSTDESGSGRLREGVGEGGKSAGVAPLPSRIGEKTLGLAGLACDLDLPVEML